MPRQCTRLWPFSALFAAVLILDQLTKHAITARYAVGESRSVFPWLRMTYVQNTGATWGILQDSNAILIALSILALCALLYYRTEFGTTAERACYAFLLAGIAGNLIDRLSRGFVVDFIDFGRIFPYVFNFADSAITLGIGLYLLEHIRKHKKQR